MKTHQNAPERAQLPLRLCGSLFYIPIFFKPEQSPFRRQGLQAIPTREE